MEFPGWIAETIFGALFVIFLTLIVKMARWAEPHIVELITILKDFLGRMDARLDTEEARAINQLAACQKNITTVTSSHKKLEAQSAAIIEMLRGAEVAVTQVIDDNAVAAQVRSHLAEAERIIREAS